MSEKQKTCAAGYAVIFQIIIPGLRKQEFLRNIYSVSWQDCGTELMAFLFECVEIRTSLAGV